MRLWTSAGLLLLVVLSLVGFSKPAAAVVLYRIGTPLTAAEKDSLEDLDIDFREMGWTQADVLSEVDLDQLQVDVLQPNFFETDENIAATALSRGGLITIHIFASDNSKLGQVMLDEDETTGYTFDEINPESFGSGSVSQERVSLDLGGEFLVREVRFRPRAETPEKFVEQFRIGVSNTPISAFRIFNLPVILEVKENTDPDVRVRLEPPITTRVVQLQIFRVTPKELELVEFEVFGGGFVTSSSYVSEVIELEDIASWGEISWSGRRDPDARIELATRTGSDPQSDVFWEARPEQQDSIKYLGGGGDLSAKEYKERYEGLPGLFKPEDERHYKSPDTENWSLWSSPYPFEESGVDIRSPSPRQFIQLRAEFSATTDDGGQIDYIEFKASVPPSVRELVGEIYPVETVVGELTRFTYYVSPTIMAGDPGFDGIEISGPSGIAGVDSLRIDAINQEDFTWNPKDDGMGVEVELPRRMETTDSGALIEVVFNAPVFREVGNFFDGKVFNSQTPMEVRQQIIPGNAADEVESEVLSVRTSLSKSLLFSPRVFPNSFTPNGDGINDRLDISYTILRVTSPVRVSVEIFDLSGSLVREVYAGEDPLGEYSHAWDGRDRSNKLVPPGLYLYRIVVDVHSGQETKSGVLSVVY